MTLEKLASKYIGSAEQVFRNIATSKGPLDVDVEKVKNVLAWAEAYLQDARYYREKKKFEVSLTSVAYCEGLLDALRLMGAVSFEWPRRLKRIRRAK